MVMLHVLRPIISMYYVMSNFQQSVTCLKMSLFVFLLLCPTADPKINWTDGWDVGLSGGTGAGLGGNNTEKVGASVAPA